MNSRRVYSTCLAAAVTATLACTGVLTATGAQANTASPAGQTSAADLISLSGPAPTVVLNDATVDVGATLYSDWDGDIGTYSEWVVPMTLHWTATAAATGSICSQAITERGYEWLGGDDDPILGSNTGTMALAPRIREFSTNLEFYDYYRGGYQAVVRATDCTGVVGASRIARARVGLREDNSPTLRYAGPWRTSRCTCASGLSRHYSQKRGSSVEFSTNPRTGNDVALVMAKGPTRGRATVYVDGRRVATVHTYAATAVSKAITWQMPFTDGARHVVKVVNQGTAGHSRIDLDVVIN